MLLWYALFALLRMPSVLTVAFLHQILVVSRLEIVVYCVFARQGVVVKSYEIHLYRPTN
jgi:hypothetical protein